MLSAASNAQHLRISPDGPVTLTERVKMIFRLITLEGVVRGERVAVVAGAPIPGRGHLPLRVAAFPVPAQDRGTDAPARGDRLPRDRTPLVSEVGPGLRRRAAAPPPARRQMASRGDFREDQRRATVPVMGRPPARQRPGLPRTVQA